MFTFVDTPVKFLGLLVLFAWCTVWCCYELTRPQNLRQRISNVLHLVMAVVMLLMVAGPTWRLLVAVVDDTWLAIGFGAATAWFCWLAARAFTGGDRSGGWHGLGHAAMFGAMTWHLAAMATMSSAMSGMSGHGGMGGGMDMASWMAAQSRPGGTLWLFALVGLPFMAYLLASSLYALWQVSRPPLVVAAPCACGPACTCGPDCACGTSHPAVEARQLVTPDGVALTAQPPPAALAYNCHEVRPQGSGSFRLANLADFAMNAGMFWMSTGLLVPILPFLAELAF
ncbi:DUF5134 domain-containing protein [Micropruina sonneratiae]|uniref:DUF5134 domain-containing protein n=1 Tax=Micropruina sonneratiae TaxID=2986940 RepID=UPI002226D814|nr:DUF5134 domain-containing protein [Micropruina sp. KQZ13P-5]MCW3159022.1 DUF5134 domain-containing protein [Micropruina sp. KQZ13P-5]